MSILKKIVIFSGGTMVHVRPHLAICAPAFGQIGDDVYHALQNWTALNEDEFRANFGKAGTFNYIVEERTRMSGGDTIVTNEDLSKALDKHLADPNVGAIIMAAAICDFEPESVMIHDYGSVWQSWSGIGKMHPRLDSSKSINLKMEPAEKLIAKIKAQRPDIYLVGFKTTSDEPTEALMNVVGKSLEANECDLVFGNDIARRINMIKTETNEVVSIDRHRCITILADCVMQAIIERMQA